MSAAGDDPFRVEKSHFLEATRTFRSKLCDDDRKDRTQASLLSLARRLKNVWARADMSHAERRRILFSLWDECTEAPSNGPDDKSGEMARGIVLSFIAEHLPATSEHAFPREEILALNAGRRSKQLFDPYER